MTRRRRSKIMMRQARRATARYIEIRTGEASIWRYIVPAPQEKSTLQRLHDDSVARWASFSSATSRFLTRAMRRRCNRWRVTRRLPRLQHAPE